MIPESLSSAQSEPKETPLQRRGGRSITPEFVRRVQALIEENRTVRRSLPGWGRLHLDRQLPFLIVYRRPRAHDDVGTSQLVKGEAAYLMAPSGVGLQTGVRDLVQGIAKAGVDLFGGFLVLEIWAGEASSESASNADFRIHSRGLYGLQPTITTLTRELQRMRVRRRSSTVEQTVGGRLAPPGRGALIPERISGVYWLGVEVPPVYRGGESGPVYPLVLRRFHRELAVVLKKTSFRFAKTLTTHQPKHYHALGRRIFVKAVWDVDRRLAGLDESFDFLLAVSPINGRRAWAEFVRSGYKKTPRFLYPSLGITPGLVKRELYAIPIERIEDPELSYIFEQKRDDLDRKLTGLIDRGSRRFVLESEQIFGGAESDLVDLANTILESTAGRSEERRGGGHVDAESFAARARAEIERYRVSFPRIASEVRIRDDVTGLIVSRGNLLVPRDLSIPEYRLEALIQHEIGTHVLTYVNGRAQPFRQLYLGLSGYDGLQEGLAVLSEHLVGGLTPARLRLLAARVTAVKSMLDGAGFVDVFRSLRDALGFSRRTAFTITMRVFRGGGLTKDAVYLRGFASLLHHVRSGGPLEPLFVGKVATEHLPVIEELLGRKALKPPPLRPTYLEDPEALKRLAGIQRGATVEDLIPRRTMR